MKMTYLTYDTAVHILFRYAHCHPYRFIVDQFKTETRSHIFCHPATSVLGSGSLSIFVILSSFLRSMHNLILTSSSFLEVVSAAKRLYEHAV